MPWKFDENHTDSEWYSVFYHLYLIILSYIQTENKQCSLELNCVKRTRHKLLINIRHIIRFPTYKFLNLRRIFLVSHSGHHPGSVQWRPHLSLVKPMMTKLSRHPRKDFYLLQWLYWNSSHPLPPCPAQGWGWLLSGLLPCPYRRMRSKMPEKEFYVEVIEQNMHEWSQSLLTLIFLFLASILSSSWLWNRARWEIKSSLLSRNEPQPDWWNWVHSTITK